ncbi:divalent cation transporter [Aliiglaciecola sp. LCG003]|uniref:ZIP family metal transporter n=1 Tax=Aliiglaciecola sp. LCG003 TaxID=3053655 RepID=UPI00257324B1|nr:divalent cation transporter [Aliiglaciecola sp. LCG003]WJG11179.1 divalent cation transporter [Aliiglaciecola sp. LCG003]
MNNDMEAAMEDWQEVVLLTFIAGASMPVGASLAKVEHIRTAWLENELQHFIIAFGGGALLSAVALVLIPDGIEHLSTLQVSVWFVLGALVFMFIDILLAKIGTAASQLVAMLTDFIPEALALGAAIAIGSDTALVLALIMALQNLPEGFNSFTEMRQSGKVSAGFILKWLCVLTLLGPIFGIVGFYWLADMPVVVASIMVFASGGILYIIFGDIAPQSKLVNHWAPPLGAVLGFLLGTMGHMLLS